MIDTLLTWLGEWRGNDSAFRFCVLPLVVTVMTLPLSAMWSMFGQLFGVIFRGRKQ